MRSKIFFIKGAGVEEFPHFSLFGDSTLKKFGQLVKGKINQKFFETIESQIQEDNANKSSAREEFPHSSLFGDSILKKFGQLVKGKINQKFFETIESQIQEDNANKSSAREEHIIEYINILVAAQTTSVQDRYHFVTKIVNPPATASGQSYPIINTIPSRDFFSNLASASSGHPIKIIMIANFGAHLHNYIHLLPEGSVLITLSNERSLINNLDFKHPDIRKLVDNLPASELKFEKLLQIYCLFQQFSYNEPLISVHGMLGNKDVERFGFDSAYCKDLTGQLHHFPFFDTLFKQGLLPQEVAKGVINQLASNQSNLDILKGNNLGNLGNYLSDIFKEQSADSSGASFRIVDKMKSYKSKVKKETEEQYYIPDQDKNLIEQYSIFVTDHMVSGFVKLLTHKAMWEDCVATKKSQPENFNIQDIGRNYRIDFENYVQWHQNQQIIVGTNDSLYSFIHVTGESPFHYISKYGIAMSAIFETVMIEAEQFLEKSITLKISAMVQLMRLMKFLDQEDSDEENEGSFVQTSGSVTPNSSSNDLSLTISHHVSQTTGNGAISSATHFGAVGYEHITSSTSVITSVSVTSSSASARTHSNSIDNHNNLTEDNSGTIAIINDLDTNRLSNNDNSKPVLGHLNDDCSPFPESY